MIFWRNIRSFLQEANEHLFIPNPKYAMAWRSSGSSNDELISNLKRSNIILSSSVENAMRAVDRANYAPSSPYEDSPQQIGYSATISAPHMHAYALEILRPFVEEPNSKVMDVGCGSGYLAAVLARLAPSTGKVFAIDYIPELVNLSISNTAAADSDVMDSQKLVYLQGDGWRGLPDEAPFSAIHVGAAATSVPLELVRQLKPGGVMVVPVGPQGGSQYLLKINKVNNQEPVEQSYTSESLMGVRYVPLVKI